MVGLNPHPPSEGDYKVRSWRRVASSRRLAKCLVRASWKTLVGRLWDSAALAKRVTEEWNLRLSG
jgi:hypothetical protein